MNDCEFWSQCVLAAAKSGQYAGEAIAFADSALNERRRQFGKVTVEVGDPQHLLQKRDQA